MQYMSQLLTEITTLLERGYSKKKVCKKLHVSRKIVKYCFKNYCFHTLKPKP